MRVVRVQSPGVQYLEPYFLHSDYPPEVFAEVVRSWLKNHPEETFVLAAVDGSDVLAFVVATAEEAAGDYAFIHQAYCAPHAPPGLSHRMFMRVCLWAEERGKSAIRMETRRKPDAIVRRWKFKEIATIMEYRLNDDWLPLSEEGNYNGEEVDYGTEQQPTADVQHADAGAEAGGEGSGSPDYAFFGEVGGGGAGIAGGVAGPAIGGSLRIFEDAEPGPLGPGHRSDDSADPASTD